MDYSSDNVIRAAESSLKDLDGRVKIISSQKEAKMIEIIKKMSIEARTALYLAIAENSFKSLFNVDQNDAQYKDVRKALDKCWCWAEHGNVPAIDLYKLIDSPECDGVYEYGMAEQEYGRKVMWYNIADAIAYTIWQAFNKEKVKYLPQIIEGIDEEGFNDYIKAVVDEKLMNFQAIDNLIKFLYQNYSISSPLKSKIMKQEIIKKSNFD